MIWTEKKIDKLVRTNRNKVLERLRLALGAQKYLSEPKVKAIFQAQKTRMGTRLDELDTVIQTHPREVVDAQGKKTTYYPWKRQNLLAEWNAFMDTKWEDATKKHKKVMYKWTNDLDDARCQSQAKKSPADKEFCDRLRKLQSEYRTVLAFVRPW